MTPEETSFTLGLITGIIFVITFMIASPVIQTAIDEANQPELGVPGPCQSWETGGTMNPPSDAWYKEHCWVSMNSSSIDLFWSHYKEECSCYEYTHRGIIARFREQVDKVF